MIEASAQATPDSTALVCKDQRISYGQLDVRSNQVANYLRLQGVGPEVRVGLMMGRSIEMVVWMLGILKAGGAYVPIDPAYPKSRRELIIEDSGLELIVSDHSVAEVRETVRQQSAERVDQRSEVEQSGVCDLHVGLNRKAEGSGARASRSDQPDEVGRADLQREEMDGVLATTSICFDLSVYEILVVLGLGGKVIVGRSGLEVREEIEGGEVVQLNTVPSLMEGVLREGELNASIKVVNLAGEALSRVLVEEVYARSRVERVVNLYGPSEDTTYTTMEEEERGSQKRVGIGRGIENTRIYIADERGEMVARGVRGEIYIGSESLARCYIGKGEATAERFVPDGWSGLRGERVYKTGDVGRYNKEGRIEYVGRKDQQVKVRGYRIELGEIEEVLRGMRGIREAAVKVVEGVEGGKRLVGYVVEEEGEERSGEEIRRRVREELPEAMVPGEYVKLREMPKTPNGKIDRRALPKPESGEASREYVGPRSAVEEIVSGIWAEVLRVERVGIRDNFFELGGHSLLATQVVSRVRKVFGVEVALRSLFTDATAAAMASEVEQQQSSGEGAAIAEIARVGHDEKHLLSYAQQRLWFIDQMEPGSAAYNIPSAVRLMGKLDEQALRRSLNEIVRRHEVLRTSFPSSDGEPRQYIHELSELRPDIIDLMQGDEAEREQKLEEELREEARRGFDLSSGPLIRAKLIRMGDEEHVLMVNMHHIVSDGWSMEVIVRELAQLYEALHARPRIAAA